MDAAAAVHQAGKLAAGWLLILAVEGVRGIVGYLLRLPSLEAFVAGVTCWFEACSLDVAIQKTRVVVGVGFGKGSLRPCFFSRWLMKKSENFVYNAIKI